jgi:alpha-1,3-glucan synthase
VIATVNAHSKAPNYFNLTIPPYPYLGWTFHLNDKNSRWWLTPRGSVARSIIVFALFASLPLIGGILSLLIFTNIFYPIKVNTYGSHPQGLRWWRQMDAIIRERLAILKSLVQRSLNTSGLYVDGQTTGERPAMDLVTPIKIRTVLIATLEYEILGWNLKIR